MTVQMILMIILAGLFFLLIGLLVVRVRREKRLSVLLDDLNRKEYNDFLISNIHEGTISTVARLFSDLLIKSFGCRYIVFIRKKKGQLILNYYHGIRAFNRSDFTLNLNKEIIENLRLSIFPRKIEEIRNSLPDKFIDKICSYNIDLFFPIQWKDNLYGIYFIKSTRSTRHPAFNTLITTVAQSLSAAYHIKWHESKSDMLKEKLSQINQIQVKTTEGSENVTRILKLLKHRKTDTIIPQLLQTLKDSLNIEGLALIYQSNKNQELQIIKDNIGSSLTVPENEQFYHIIDSIGNHEYIDLKKNNRASDYIDETLKSYQTKGIEFAAALPLSQDRKGLLIWTGKSDPSQIKQQLRLFGSVSPDLMENAEEFQNIESLSYTDNLTGLSNQRYFMKRLDEEINRAKRYSRKLALVMFDVDELKKINDNYGHLAGNSLLSAIGEILKNSIRTIDVVARYGGDEFCIVMPESDQGTCRMFMERLQNKIANTDFILEGVEKSHHCTVSLGGAIYPDHADEPKNLILVADKALLEAKNSGRNCYQLVNQSTIES
jgi:diguanylate cyclase (GGDEF)-like protein